MHAIIDTCIQQTRSARQARLQKENLVSTSPAKKKKREKKGEVEGIRESVQVGNNYNLRLEATQLMKVPEQITRATARG